MLLKSLKTNVLVLSTLAVLGGMTPQKSEAGVALIALSGGSTAMLVGGCVAAGIGGLAMLPSEDGYSNRDVRFYHIAGIILIVLDADGGLPQDQIRMNLQKKYKFIENTEVFNQLSQMIKTKADAMPFVNGKKTVSISRDELNSALASTDLTGLDAQVEQMAKDLQ